MNLIEPGFQDPISGAAETPGAVLIIEDCEPLLFYLNSAVLSLGFKEQHLAANLAEAHAAWVQHKEDISHVILNYELPDGIGFDFATLARRDRPDVNIIITSGYDIAAVKEVGGKSAHFRFLQKPFRLGELKSALERNSVVHALCA